MRYILNKCIIIFRTKDSLKKGFFLFFTGFLFNAFSQQNFKIFPFKSIIVEYTVDYLGNNSKAKRILYADDYGRKLCMDFTIQIDQEKKHFIYILNPKECIAVNMNMKIGARRKIPSELLDDKGLIGWFYEILYGERKRKIANKENFKRVEKLLDKECEVYESGEKKYWIWNNLILKIEDSSRIEIVSKIQTEISISSERFKAPKGVFILPKIF